MDIIEAGVGEVTEVSWSAPDGLSYEGWVQVGRTLQTIGGAINWWVGDWLNFGEQRYGEMYTQAIEATGWKLDHLQQCKWVAGQVESCTRVQGLTYTHHRHVAKLPQKEQAFWLRRAEAEGWRSGELKAEMTKVLAPVEEEDDVPFSGSGHNYCEAGEGVVEYEQGLPVLTWTAVSQVRGLVRAVVAGQWNDALVLAKELKWIGEEDG